MRQTRQETPTGALAEISEAEREDSDRYLSQAEAYLDKAYSAYWEHLEEKVPDLVPKLKEITSD